MSAQHGHCEHRNWTAITNQPPRCNDCGMELDRTRTLRGHARKERVTCGSCEGKGRRGNVICWTCKGRGKL